METVKSATDRVVRGDPFAEPSRMTWRRWLVYVALCALLIAFVVILVGRVKSGSMNAFVQRANGHELIIEFDPPDLARPGVLQKGPRGKPVVHIPVVVTNFATVPRRIVGGTADCHCVTVGNFPQTIEANRNSSIEATIRLESGQSAIDHVVSLYTNSPVDSVLTFRLVSRGH